MLAIYGLATYGHYTGGTYSLSLSPSNITPTTPQITVSGNINNFRNTVGCTVTFKTSLIRGVL